MIGPMFGWKGQQVLGLGLTAVLTSPFQTVARNIAIGLGINCFQLFFLLPPPKTERSFDSVSGKLLWEKLDEASVDRRWLFLAEVLGSPVNCYLWGELSHKVTKSRRVKLGCIWDLSPFKLFTDSLSLFLDSWRSISQS